jgi:hypothetical protein
MSGDPTLDQLARTVHNQLRTVHTGYRVMTTREVARAVKRLPQIVRGGQPYTFRVQHLDETVCRIWLEARR